MSEFKCDKCGGEDCNKNYIFGSTSTTYLSICANCDYERGAALGENIRSVEKLREAASLFRLLDDYSDASSRAKQCEDQIEALIKKRWSIARIVCACIVAAIIIARIIVANYPMIAHMLDFKRNTKKVVVYEEEDVQYVILPYAGDARTYGEPLGTSTCAFWVQPNGDCIVMFMEEIGEKAKTRFYRYNSEWEFQNELSFDVQLLRRMEPYRKSSINDDYYRELVMSVCQTKAYGIYSPVLGIRFGEVRRNAGFRLYDTIVFYDEQAQTITPIQTFNPEEDEYHSSTTIDSICSIADTYLVLWESTRSVGPYPRSIWSVFLQDEDNLIWTFSGYDMESILQSEFDLTYTSMTSLDIAADESFYYIYSWFNYIDDDEELPDALIIVLDRFGNITPLLLSSVLPELEGKAHTKYSSGDPYRFYYDGFSELLVMSLRANNGNGKKETFYYQFDPNVQQIVRQVEKRELPYPLNLLSYSYFSPNGLRYSMSSSERTPFHEEYVMEYLKDSTTSYQSYYTIIVERTNLPSWWSDVYSTG